MEKDRLHKEQQKENYDHSHRVKTAAILPENTDVWVNTQGRNVPGTVVTTATTPRSYIVTMPSGAI